MQEGVSPKKNRNLPMNTWGDSVVGGFLSSYFCIR